MSEPRPSGPCWFGHAPGYWQDTGGAWHCIECEPNPAWRRLRGVTLEALGGRSIVLQPPAGDLPQPGSWARAPAGATVELVLYSEDGAEVLMRTLQGEHLGWFEPAALMWECSWGPD